MSVDVGYDPQKKPSTVRITAENQGGSSVNLVRVGFESDHGTKFENAFGNYLPHWLHAGNRYSVPVAAEIIKNYNLAPLRFVFFRGERNRTFRAKVSDETNRLISGTQ